MGCGCLSKPIEVVHFNTPSPSEPCILAPPNTPVSQENDHSSNEDVNTKITVKDVVVSENGEYTVLNDYMLLNLTLGKGSYGTVELAQHKDNKELLAIKIISHKRGSHSNGSRVAEEIKVMMKFQHPNAVRLVDVLKYTSRTHETWYLVMEYMGKGCIGHTPGKKRPIRIPSQEALDVIRKQFIDILQGLENLHQNNVAHMDIKPENLLLDQDGAVKLSDFGLSEIFHSQNDILRQVRGTKGYCAPEMIATPCEYHAKAADVWAAGVTLYVLAFGALPRFESLEDILYPQRGTVPDDFIEVLSHMLDIIPGQRLKPHELLTLPFFHPMAELTNTNMPVHPQVIAP
jgi:serine/threonine protein kinase